MITDKLPDWVTAYIGIPFTELDCYNLIRLVKREQFNEELPDLSEEYFDAMDKDNIAYLYYRELKNNWVRMSKPLIGNIIVFRMQGILWHCGMTLNHRFMLHSMEGMNSAVEDFTKPNWKPKYEGYYKYVPQR